MTSADLDRAPPLPRQQVWLLAGGFEGGMAVLAIVVGWLVGYPPWRHLPALDDGAAWMQGIAWGVAASLPMLLAFFIMLQMRGGPLGRIARFLDDVVAPMFGSCSLADLAFVCAMAGLGEEFLFRGLVQDVTVGWLGVVAGVIVTSVLFGLAHPFTVAYVLIAAVIGVYMSWLRIATGGLLAPIVAHGLYDFIALAYFIRVRSREPQGGDSS
jgi:hypothetical protein